MRLALVVAGIAVVCAACGADSTVSGDRRVVGGVTYAFTVTPASVEPGRAVRFTLRLTNNTGRAEELTFASGQEYDFWVTKGGNEVWRWSDDRSFTQAVTTRTIGPQDSLTLTETWTSEGSGQHVAHGLLRAEGYDRELNGKLTVRE